MGWRVTPTHLFDRCLNFFSFFIWKASLTKFISHLLIRIFQTESGRPRTAATDAESLGRPMSGKEARQRRAERIASAASRILETEKEEEVEEPVEYEEFEQ